MCNLYRMTKTQDEVAQWFDAIDALGGANFSGAEIVIPDKPGLGIDRISGLSMLQPEMAAAS